MNPDAGDDPDIVVVYGSESRLLSGLFELPWRFVRLYNKAVPVPRDNCRDVAAIAELDTALAEEAETIGKNQPRIAFVGAAFRTQKSLFLAESMDEIEASVEVNISNYLRLTKVLLPRMVAARYGTFVYLSSFRATTTGKGTSVYSASKAFGERFFEVIGKEYGRLNICAVSLRMGYFEGRMTDSMPEDTLAELPRKIALGRMGSGTELVSAIQFAMRNRYLNGGVLDLAGGISFD